MTERQKLSRRKLLLGLATVGVAGAGVGGGTVAYITDDESKTLTFESGSIVLVISPPAMDFDQDDGDEMKETSSLSNSGTLLAKEIQMSGLVLDGSKELQRASELTTFEYRGQGILGKIENRLSDVNNNGIYDLRDLKARVESNPIDLEALVSGDGLDPDGQETAELTIGVTMDYSQITSNSQTLSAELVLSAVQDSS